MKSKYLIIALVILGNFSLHGTPQTGDMLIVNSDTIYLNSQLPLGPIEDRIKGQISYYQNNWSTGCYNGYYSLWELENDSLFFRKIIPCNFSDGNSASVRVHADWITQKVFAPYGKKYKYLHQGWGYLYEYENQYTFNKGILESESTLDNSKYHLANIYEDSDIYRQFVLDNFDLKSIDTTEFTGKNAFTVVEVSIDEDGFVKEVKCDRVGMPSVCAESRRVISKIDRLSVYYQNGKILFGKYNFPFNYFIIKKWKQRQ